MKTYSRADRLSELIQRKIAEILIRQISDQRLCFLTITAVKMTTDLKIAKIYFVTPANVKKNDAIKAFKKASGFIKHNLAKHLETRYMPELRFYYDETFEYSGHIEKILKDIKSETDKNNDT
ncbi:MAG: 30S ribosome-binding factor RbfA [Deltaproteobacteria bacterium]|nr:30S ribosome-binding factor RbfA [Deltaproteobacteria bacterium]